MNRFGRTAASAALIVGLATMGSALAQETAAPSNPPAAAQQKTGAQSHAAKAAVRHAAKANTHVKAVQEALIKHGAKLKADGVMGRHTRIALRQFQKKNGLKATGRADKATLEKLGVAS